MGTHSKQTHTSPNASNAGLPTIYKSLRTDPAQRIADTAHQDASKCKSPDAGGHQPRGSYQGCSKNDINCWQTCADGHAHQTDRLSALPNELKLMIWEKLDQDADRTCFALTCKANAQFYNSLEIKSGPPQRSSPEQKVNLLQRLRCFLTLGRHQLCFKCGKYRPAGGGWSGDTRFGLLRNVLACPAH